MIGSRSLRGRLVAMAATGSVALVVLAAPTPLQPTVAASAAPGRPSGGAATTSGPALIAPPPPPTDRPKEPAGYQSPSARRGSTGSDAGGARSAPSSPTGSGSYAAASTSSTVAAPASAVTWGAAGAATTLVVYDTTSTYGWLGELYAMAAGNLASHFGTVTAEPVVDYVAGQLNSFTATIYLGSTYNEPIPSSFLNDVVTSAKPVVWAGDNIWQLSGTGTADASFQSAYGWDPSTTYFDTSDSVTQVLYNGQTLSRSGSDGTLLAPHITSSSQVSVLGWAQCGTTAAPTTCASIAQTPAGASTFPWAIRSANLTFVGEIPLSYVDESDRYLAFSDLLYSVLAPNAPAVHQALVRLEDVSPGIDTPAQLKQIADYLAGAGVPFSVGVIPDYEDPNGYYNNGVPVSENIAQTSNATVAAFNDALRYMISKGGTIIEHGYTHQYSNVPNPYSGVSGDDFEFYRAQCASTETAPYTFDYPCPNTDWVIQEGALPNDSAAWAQSRALTGQQLFTKAGFVTPTIWETPHYSASAVDYQGIDGVYQTRYEREQFFGGQLTGNTAGGHLFGQFFPYVVHDVYGETVLPEDLGNFEPATANNNPPKPPAYIIGNAQAELAVRQGVASFFFHPYYQVTYLQQIVQGIQALGYKFVAPAQLLPKPPAPAVSSISPTTGPASGGTQVTITGSNLGGATAVNFGAARAKIVSDTLDQIVAVAPSSPAGPVSVAVTTGGGTSAGNPSAVFTFVGTTSTSLAASKNPVPIGTPVTFTARVVPTSGTGGPAPTGAVAFTDNGSVIPGCSSVALSSAGNATCTVTYPSTGKGSHTIAATYTGDTYHSGSSAQLVEQVGK